MGAPSVDIKDELVSASIGTFGGTTGWGIYVSDEPKDPDTTVSIFDTGGTQPDAKWIQDEPTVMVRVRGAPQGYVAAYAKAQDVKDALLGIDPKTINATRYVGIWMNGDIISVGQDENNRPILSLNFRITRHPDASTYRETL